VPVTQNPVPHCTSVVQLRRAQRPETQSKVEGQGVETLQLWASQRLPVQVLPVGQGLVALHPGAQSFCPLQAQTRG